MHAMSQLGETPQVANNKMMAYFTGEASKYIKTSNFKDLCMAIHPIMDAYASPHSGFKIFDGTDKSWLLHYSELIVFMGDNRIRFFDSYLAARFVYEELCKFPSNLQWGDIANIFDKWLVGYEY